MGMIKVIIADMTRELKEAKATATAGEEITWVWRWEDGYKDSLQARTEEGAARQLHAIEAHDNKVAEWKTLRPILTESEANGWYQEPDRRKY